MANGKKLPTWNNTKLTTRQITTNNKRLRFLHIPKTAGTSFFDCLKRLYPGEFFQFGPDNVMDLAKYQELETSQKSKIVLIGGHIPYLLGEQEIGHIPTLTFLREPVARVKSYCQHIREGKSEFLRRVFPPETFNLDEFLNSGHFQLENMQTRMLIGHGLFRTLQLPSLPDETLVDTALGVLQNELVGFGVVEYFEASLMHFKKLLDWDWPTYVKLNERNKSNLLTFEKRHIDQIRALNAIDIGVYDRAIKIFQARLREPDFFNSASLYQFRIRQLWFRFIALRIRP